MKSILISIKPRFVADILNGKKTIEIRKTCPKNFKGWIYIYCTKGRRKERLGKRFANEYGIISQYSLNYMCSKEEEKLNGKVVARFYLKKVEKFNGNFYDDEYLVRIGCVSWEDLHKYFRGGQTRYAWHIDNLEIFDRPKELSDFETCWKKAKGNKNEYHRHALNKAPQSYMFVETEN